MCFNQRCDISTLNDGPLKLVDMFTYLRSIISSTKNYINMWLTKAWTAINRLLVIWKSDLSDKIKCSDRINTAIWMHYMNAKCMEKKLDDNYIRMLLVVLNKSWGRHPTKQQLYSHQPPITKSIQIRWTRHIGHCWRSKDELISDVLLWTPSCGWASAGQRARTYIQQLCADTGCSLEDLPEAIDDRDGWQERVREICAGSMTWWWLPNSALKLYNWK